MFGILLWPLYISKGCSYNLSYGKMCFFCHVLSGAESLGLINIWCFQDGNEVAKKKSFVTPPRFFSVDEARYFFCPFCHLMFFRISFFLLLFSNTLKQGAAHTCRQEEE